MPEFIHTEIIVTQKSGPKPYRVRGLELIRLLRGHVTWQLDGQPVLVRERELLLIRPGQTFSGIDSPESVPIRAQRVRVHPPAASTAAHAWDQLLELGFHLPRDDAQRLRRALTRIPGTAIPASFEVTALFDELARLELATSPLARLHARHLVLAILSALAAHSEHHPSREIGTESPALLRVKQTLAQLEARCEEPWTLESIAAHAELKRSRFGILCRRLTGESPSTYLNRLRIRKSRRLLRDSELSITDISLRCGFGSSQYFSKVFRRFQGFEPSHFREICTQLASPAGVSFLKCDSAKIVVFAEPLLGAGDFSISGRLSVERLGATATSIEFGHDRFGFDGETRRLFLEGDTIGGLRHLRSNQRLIHPHTPFDFAIVRCKNRLAFSIAGQPVAEIVDSPSRPVGRVGLRPMRNALHIHSFQLNGAEVPLRSPVPDPREDV